MMTRNDDKEPIVDMLLEMKICDSPSNVRLLKAKAASLNRLEHVERQWFTVASMLLPTINSMVCRGDSIESIMNWCDAFVPDTVKDWCDYRSIVEREWMEYVGPARIKENTDEEAR